MKPKAYFFTILAALAFMTGCYDDDKAWDAISGHEERIRSLENWQKTTTSNIEALRVLSGDKEHITGVTPILHGDIAVGYAITFKNHAPVSIYHGATGPQGEPGETGITPDISIARGEDGNWYWTLNGAPLTDGEDKPVPVNPQDGKPGSAVPAPMVKTGQQLTDSGATPTEGNPPAWTPGAVYLSTDGGTTWRQVSGPKGANGKPTFVSVDTESDPNSVVFTLAGGTTLTVPRYKPITIDFTYNPTGNPEAEYLPVNLSEACLPFPAGNGDYYINYTLSAPEIDEKDIRVSVYCAYRSDWKAVIDRTNKSIRITPDGTPGSRELLQITATDNNGHSSLYMLELKHYFDGYDGSSKEQAFTISCVQELDSLAKSVNTGNERDKYFRMDNNINLGGKKRMPIGRKTGTTPTNPFSGNFDGSGFCIRGLKINTDEDYAGLFGAVENGNIENLTLISPEIETSGKQCGAFAGYCENGTIKNCYVKDGKCTAKTVAGGLTGEARNTTIYNCHVKRTVITTRSGQAGGLAGYISLSDIKQTITNCSASDCSLTAAQEICGGLTGTFEALNQTELTMTYCYATGTITSNGKAGALIGNTITSGDEKINITCCYSACTIDDKRDASPRLIGYQSTENNALYKACYYITAQTAETPIPGLTYQPAFSKAMIDAMNKSAYQSSQTMPFQADGSLKTENWKK